MKNHIRLLIVALALTLCVGPIMVVAGCSSTPATRNQTVATLKAVGHTAEAAVSLSAQLFADGKITNDQAYAVFEFYNQKFRPAFRSAVLASKMNVDSISPQEVIDLSSELTAMVSAFR